MTRHFRKINTFAINAPKTIKKVTVTACPFIFASNQAPHHPDIDEHSEQIVRRMQRQGPIQDVLMAKGRQMEEKAREMFNKPDFPMDSK